jgi:hypothetical protein
VKSAFVARLEIADAAEHLDEGVLDQIVGVEGAARPRGQAAVCPALQAWEISSAQLVLRHQVAVMGTADQSERRLCFRAAFNRWNCRYFGHFCKRIDGQAKRVYHTPLSRRGQ